MAPLALVVIAALWSPKIDCKTVDYYVQKYGKSEVVRLARKWGYGDRLIKAAEAKCSRH